MFRADLQPLLGALIPGVLVVALRESENRRPDEAGLEPVDGARSVTEHAVDAHAELLVPVQFFGSLPVFARGNGLLRLANDPGLHFFQLAHEVADLDHEIPHHGEIAQGFHPYRSRQALG